jgi:hypothetical protein
MTPFINRRYPVLNIVEIEFHTPLRDLTITLDHMTFHIAPVRANEVLSLFLFIVSKWVVGNLLLCCIQSSEHVIAISATITANPGNDTGCSAPHEMGTTHLVQSAVSFIPLPVYFEAFPSLSTLLEISSERSGAPGIVSKRSANPNMVCLFIPLAVSSFLPCNLEAATFSPSTSFRQLRQLCYERNSVGIVYAVRTNAMCCCGC